MTEKEQLTKELTKKFWSNIDDKIGPAQQQQQVLYHYSGIESLMGMLETNNIWMSKGTFLNDSNELIYIAEILEAVLEKIEQRIISIYGRGQKIEEIVNLISVNLTEMKKKFQEDIHVDDFEAFIFSLTRNKDSLALWYNYAKGDGYNIGFSSAEMLRRMSEFAERIKNQYNFVYGQVVYEKAEQETLLIEFILDIVDHLLRENIRLNSSEVEDVLANHFFSIITTCSVFFKNEAFKSEEEFRIAFPKRISAIKEKDKLELLFRSQNGIVIPFIMVDFYSKLPISEVTIGPKNNIDVAKSGMEQYLKSKGYNLDEITIGKSIAELRF